MIALALVWMVPWLVFVIIRRAAWLAAPAPPAEPGPQIGARIGATS